MVDTCPYAPQPQWCPLRDGEVNQCGMHNLFEIAMKVDDLKNLYGWSGHYIKFDVIDFPASVNSALQAQMTWMPTQCPLS